MDQLSADQLNQTVQAELRQDPSRRISLRSINSSQGDCDISSGLESHDVYARLNCPDSQVKTAFLLSYTFFFGQSDLISYVQCLYRVLVADKYTTSRK